MTRSRSTSIEATYRIVTPMFCSGSDQNTAELRLPSFKGALRFWWRATEWGRFHQTANGNVGRALKLLSDEEDALFGSCTTGQSRVVMNLRWTPPHDSELVRDWPRNKPPTGSTYLGFGITESGTRGRSNYKPHRIGIPCGREFHVRCRIRPGTETGAAASVERALKLVGLLGGLGSRSRRGFGAIAITSLNGHDCTCPSTDVYRSRIRDALDPASCSDTFPPITAFSSNARMAFVSTDSDVFRAHNSLGECYREFRGQPVPYRGATKIPLGLPLKDVDQERRRGSPLLMHVHPVADQFVGSVLFLPGRFHPEIPDGNSLSYFEIASAWLSELKGVAL